MAKAGTLNPFRKFLIVAGILGVCQLVFIFWFSSGEKTLDPKDAIRQALQKAPDSQPTRQLAVAIQLYRTQNEGKLPENLSLLVPTYIEAIPVDPATGKQIAYRVDGSRFVLGIGATKATASSTTAGGAKATVAKTAAEDISVQYFLKALAESPNRQLPPYDGAHKRDPFKPFSLGESDPFSTGKQPLEAFDINDLKLTAVIEQSGSQPKAIIETPSGQGFTVNKGMKVGTKGGEIVEILGDRISVLETYSDFTGENHNKTVEIYMKARTQGAERGASRQQKETARR